MANLSRRSFIKLSVLTGLAALIPVDVATKLLVDNRDPETKFVQFLLENYDDEVYIYSLIRSYMYASSVDSHVTSVCRQFCVRQPHIVVFLRSRIVIDRTGKFVTSNNSRYNSLKCGQNIDNMSQEEWRNKVDREYNRLATRFSLPLLKSLT
jgi:hypothetical protein